MDEIGVLWLRDGEMRGFRPKIVVKLDKIPNIFLKPSKIIFPGKNKPSVVPCR